MNFFKGNKKEKTALRCNSVIDDVKSNTVDKTKPRQGSGQQNIYSNKVSLKNFEQYVKRSIENGFLKEQHEMIDQLPKKQWMYGILPPNNNKNRYNQIIAYDETRVKLNKIDNDPYSDYINANYINGYNCPNAYIATQGPKSSTEYDFWRMIWQENVNYIIMLTNVVEGGTIKCAQYWPDVTEVTRTYKEFTIQFDSSDMYADFEYRIFDIICNGEMRRIRQYHFTSWPDHGVPLYPQSLFTFLRMMLRIPQTSSSPIVVHCSAGIGRTGTIILCDICLRMAAAEKALDPFNYLYEMRQNRPSMINNIDQYHLVHLILIECLITPSYTIPIFKLEEKVKELRSNETLLREQLKMLNENAWVDKVCQSPNHKVTIAPENVNKNRFSDIIADEGRIYLPVYSTDPPNSDYINAIAVDGFRLKNQYIVTEFPMTHTLENFWRLISYKDCKVIVVLNKIPLHKNCCECWPVNNNSMNFSNGITVTHVNTEEYDFKHFDIHHFTLQSKRQDKRQITIIQFKKWNYKRSIPEDAEQFINFWDEAESLSRGKHPTLIMCYNGATACGIYVAISFIVEKIKLEQECDVYLALRVVRRNRKQFVTKEKQLKFLYEAAEKYLTTFDDYANFQPIKK